MKKAALIIFGGLTLVLVINVVITIWYWMRDANM